VKLSNNGMRGAVSKRRLALFVRGKALPALALGLGSALVFAGHALAQATSPTGGLGAQMNTGLGAQMNTMSSEAINSGGEAFGMGCYLAAALCFGLGVWALWQSRQPQNRETGYVGRGLAGLILCGLFATAGVWINKASVTASGGNATVNDTPGMVQFGTGAAGG
jgi:hypothetical protein